MKPKVDYKDGFIVIEKNVYGGYVLKYDINTSYPFKRVFYGCPKKEAIRLFKNDIKKEEESIFVNIK